jgi:methionyl-tRNA synthetase
MKTLVTSALPYANGAMHLGHVRSTYIPADIYVRYLRAKGEDVKYVCGTDEHGTPIGIKAEAEGKTPKEIGDRYHAIIAKELKDLGISFDNFSQTSRKIHHETAQDFFKKIRDNGHIIEKNVKQLYCESCNRFLPDRYVVGVCTHCGSEARGDHCEGCGRHLSVSEIKDPKCASCGASPILKETTHFFFKLSDFTEQLKEYLNNKDISSNARNYAKQWLKELNDWDITRDMDWGVKIPGAEGKVTYVWFDAPIGYVSFTKEILDNWREYWDSRVVHFIGKDIIYHHVLFWPAMLLGTREFKTPSAVQAGGFLTLEGQKMSTSRNHVVWISDYLKSFSPDYLRFFLISAAALDQDIDFSWQKFGEKVNAELIGNYGNFINRALSFCKSKFDGKLPKLGELDENDKEIIEKLKKSHAKVSNLLEEFNFIEALKGILALSRAGNEYFQNKEPWKGGSENCIHISVNLARSLAVMAEPFMPFSSKALLEQICPGCDDSWDSAAELSLQEGQEIGEVKPIFKKIEQSEIKEQLDKLKRDKKQKKIKPKKKMIEFDDFEKLDLRVAEVLEVEDHPDADKLYVLKIDLGDEQRQIVAGLKAYYKPEDIKGRKIVVIANLKPAKLRGVESQGMLLAAGEKDKVVFLSPESDIDNGTVLG